MIRVEINEEAICDYGGSDMMTNMFICKQLDDAGIPILGGPLLPVVDLSKGELVSWNEHKSSKVIFVWTPNE